MGGQGVRHCSPRCWRYSPSSPQKWWLRAKDPPLQLRQMSSAPLERRRRGKEPQAPGEEGLHVGRKTFQLLSPSQGPHLGPLSSPFSQVVARPHVFPHHFFATHQCSAACGSPPAHLGLDANALTWPSGLPNPFPPHDLALDGKTSGYGYGEVKAKSLLCSASLPNISTFGF